jgi:hypothetical protein
MLRIPAPLACHTASSPADFRRREFSPMPMFRHCAPAFTAIALMLPSPMPLSL